MLVKSSPSKLIRRINVIGDRVAYDLSPKYRAIKVGAANSLCDEARLLGLQKLASEVSRRHLRGNLVECGVYRGGSAVVIAERLLRGSRQREMWLFDVFSGMPQPGPNDPPEAWADVGKFVSNEGIVQETFATAKLPLDRVHIVTGRYEVTLPEFKPFPIAFLHLDCDWYTSVKLCLDTFYKSVVPGGAVVFDDYGFWSGCRRAVDEFLAKHSVDVHLTPIDFTSHFFFKP